MFPSISLDAEKGSAVLDSWFWVGGLRICGVLLGGFGFLTHFVCFLFVVLVEVEV